MKILNLTQHDGTPAQIEQGLYEPKDKERVKKLLTFKGKPSGDEIWNRAAALAEIANDECLFDENGERNAMIGGAPYLMSALEAKLLEHGIFPQYSYSDRVSVEVHNADGSVTKKQDFKHIDFMLAAPVGFEGQFKY